VLFVGTQNLFSFSLSFSRTHTHTHTHKETLLKHFSYFFLFAPLDSFRHRVASSSSGCIKCMRNIKNSQHHHHHRHHQQHSSLFHFHLLYRDEINWLVNSMFFHFLLLLLLLHTPPSQDFSERRERIRKSESKVNVENAVTMRKGE
jgi:hypothetical protein